MARHIEIETDQVSLFHNKMLTPQRAALYRDWEAFMKFFKEDKEVVLEPMDLAKNTAIHLVIRSNNPRFLTELLEMLPVPDRWRALRKKNALKYTVLHSAVTLTNVEIVDLILKYEKELPPPPDEEIEEPEDKQQPLLESRNALGESPLYMAATRGKLKMLKHVAKCVRDIQLHFHRDADKTSILHHAIIGQHFDVTIWLLKVDENLAGEMDDKGLTSLQLLSKMPFVFRSHYHMGTIKKLIYFLLPEQGYEGGVYDDGNKILKRERDIESGKDDVKPPTSVISRINHAIWKRLGKEWDVIDHIWQKKKQHNLVECLAELLVRKDNSWRRLWNVEQRTVVVLPVIHPSNIAAGKKQTEILKKENESSEQTTRTYGDYVPLLLASSTGIVEIVEKIIELYPAAIFHTSEDEQNILHVAVKHRQMGIYRIIKRYDLLKLLAHRISNKGRTLLHQVATMDYYRGGDQAGYAFQLQDELRWFERVKKIVNPHFIMHCNEDNLTAREQFEIEHADMLKEAQNWIKDTAESCSAVAVLVATVVFAAAYTVPGGSDANGFPKFLRSPMFLFFTIMDVAALASSLSSVVMFLSILTSPFELQEFHKSLPRKLMLGFTLLFFSLITTMLAFSATILATVRLQSDKWSLSLIYSAAFFPVTIFGLMQFPFYMAIKGWLKQFLKNLKKLVPSSLIKSSKKIKKRKYR